LTDIRRGSKSRKTFRFAGRGQGRYIDPQRRSAWSHRHTQTLGWKIFVAASLRNVRLHLWRAAEKQASYRGLGKRAQNHIRSCALSGAGGCFSRGKEHAAELRSTQSRLQRRKGRVWWHASCDVVLDELRDAGFVTCPAVGIGQSSCAQESAKSRK